MEVYVPIDDLWVFIKKNRERLKDEEPVVLEDKETGIYACVVDDDGYPSIAVYDNEGLLLCEEGLLSDSDCVNTMTRIASKYFVDSDGNNENNCSEESNERDDCLTLAMCEFLKEALEYESIDDVIESYGLCAVKDVLNMTLDYMVFDCKMPVRLPAEYDMVLYDDYWYGE